MGILFGKCQKQEFIDNSGYLRIAMYICKNSIYKKGCAKQEGREDSCAPELLWGQQNGHTCPV